MRTDWESHLEQWILADVIDTATGQRIRAWEKQHARPQGLRWPILIALAFGALLLGAGVLLFVSAHWDELSASQRMTLVLLIVGIFHVGGAFAAGRFEGLSIALHTIGTIALGAGIALAGQIFHLSEHWPTAILLWAVGSALAWALLRHWTQAALTAILIPHWLASEWWLRVHDNRTNFEAPIATFVCALAFTYLSARRAPDDSVLRKALGWLGGLALLPAAAGVAAETWTNAPSWQEQSVAWTMAIIGPLALAVLLRGRDAVWNSAAIAWTLALVAINGGKADRIPVYIWCALGAVGLVAWGIRESRAERVNLGVAGFAITVLAFYFSNVMDKLGRSFSLIVLGFLFLGGGWVLERTRRRLIARLHPEGV
jgi:uncharacterized membrane protein